MTTRIVTFDDGVNTATVPSTATTTGPTGATGPQGQAFQVDLFDHTFTETSRATIEAFGDPGSGHGVVTAINPYIVVVATDSRSAAERTAGPAALNRDLTNSVIEWGGATTAGNGLWVDYGQFTGVNGTAATISVGTTTTGSGGTDAAVVNSGNSTTAIFDFTVPTGDTGPAGPDGQPGFNNPSAVTLLAIDWNTSTLYTKTISVDSTFTFSNVDATTNNGKAILLYLTNSSLTEKTITWPTTPLTEVNSATTTVMAGSSKWLFSFLNVANTIVATGRPV